MDREDCFELISELYEFYNIEVVQNRNFEFTPNKSEITTINKFIDKLHKQHDINSLGLSYFSDFFEAQFSYWMEMYESGGMKHGLNYLKISWIIGDKAVKRYNNFSKNDWNSHLNRKIRKKLRISLKRFQKPIGLEKYLELQEHEELEKNRFHNTKAGLMWCRDNTFLRNDKSKFCLNCLFKEDCLKLLKTNYKQIHKLRFNEVSK